MARRAYLAVEFACLYAGVPLVLTLRPGLVMGLLIPSLLLGSAGMVVVLRADPTFDRARLWGASGWTAGVRPILTPFLVGAPLLGTGLAMVEPERLFAFPREQPAMWLAVCLLYPALSVYPQEIIFRVFLFHRYRELFKTERARIAVSALAFGAAHVFFGHTVAIVLSTIGGVLFARTYARSGSTFQACAEHALWGDYLFTIGLGWYFYTGSIGV